jgi:4-methylaminobutanoate oxidase (formaldehyde-forming)
MAQNAMKRVPALENAGVKQLTNGPESFTPDGNFILGEAPEVRSFYVGAGFNAFGIAAGGGAGKALAEWITGGEQPMDLWTVDIRRFSEMHREDAWVRDRTLELYGKHYTMAWPHEEHTSGRPCFVSPLFQRLKAANACFGSKLGWERPNWFADHPNPKDEYSFGRQNWFDYVGKEHQAARERVALFDSSSFAKYEISGRDAEQALSWICANDVSGPPGKLTYTQLLNSSGRIECDLTVARLASDLFYMVTGTGYRTHDKAWILNNIDSGLDAGLADITEQWGTLALMGPRSRDVLSQVTDADLSNIGFPFGRYREITVAGEAVRALRVTFVGELGWELHMPIETTGTVYDALMSTGAEFGIANAGYRAIESLRLEKGYRVWSADITPSDSPLEAGLDWAVKLNSGIPFLGREATARLKNKPLSKRLTCFTVDDPGIILLGRETIYRNGIPVGWLTSGGWGYTVQKNIGYGYVRNAAGVSIEFLKSGTYELEVACERVPCDLQLTVLYDPEMKKLKS